MPCASGWSSPILYFTECNKNNVYRTVSASWTMLLTCIAACLVFVYMHSVYSEWNTENHVSLRLSHCSRFCVSYASEEMSALWSQLHIEHSFTLFKLYQTFFHLSYDMSIYISLKVISKYLLFFFCLFLFSLWWFLKISSVLLAFYFNVLKFQCPCHRVKQRKLGRELHVGVVADNRAVVMQWISCCFWSSSIMKYMFASDFRRRANE
jgi:hypothetical protein